MEENKKAAPGVVNPVTAEGGRMAEQQSSNSMNTSSKARNQSTHRPSYDEALAEFSEFARTHGIDFDRQRVVLGQLQRWPTFDRPQSKDSATVLHLDGRAAGYVENFRTGVKANWHTNGCANAVTVAQRCEIDQAEQGREADQREKHDNAAQRALAIWQRNEPAGHKHPYLVAKGVTAFGLRQVRGSLIVPVRDCESRLQTLQFISASGDKKFLTGGSKSGGFHAIGSCPALQKVVVIAEGYATGASAHMATGWPIAVAFDAGNLIMVSRSIRAKFPRVRIILAADNDQSQRGLEAATAASQAIDGIVVMPPRLGDDFNDMARQDGLNAVRTLIMGVAQ